MIDSRGVLAGAAVLALLAAACGTEVRRVGDDDGAGLSGGGGAGVGGAAGGTSTTTTAGGGVMAGDYLLSVTIQQSPSKPLPFLTTVSSDAQGVSLALVPLDADDRMTPVGGATTHGPYAVDENGLFVADLGALMVPGATNPLTSSDLIVELTLRAQQTSPLPCGLADGQITSPVLLNIDGSEFAMVPVLAPGELPGAVLNCAGDMPLP